MLRAFQAGGVTRQLFVAKSRRHQANAIDVARWNAYRSAQAHKQGVDVRTLAAQITGFKHGFDITFAATFDLRFAPSVTHHPVVDGTDFFKIGLRALDGILSRCLHDTVGGQQMGGASEVFQGSRIICR